MLGCGEYTAVIFQRGGAAAYMVIPWNTIDWARDLDDTSEAKLHLEGLAELRTTEAGQECCGLLGGIRPWKHELAIYRAQDGIWAGPVSISEWSEDTLDLTARDLSAWWDHRVIHGNYAFSATVDLATIFETIAKDAMLPDNSPGISVTTVPTGIKEPRNYVATQYLNSGQELRSLSSAGVDWTFVGRVFTGGGVTTPAAPVGPLIDEHLESVPKVRIDGTAKANREISVGAGVGAAGANIHSEATDAAAKIRDGLLESSETDSSITTAAGATNKATTRLALHSPDAPEVDEIVLAETAPVTLAELIPGAEIELSLRHTCVPVDGTFRLAKVAGNRTAAGETITLTLQPLGTV